MWLFIQQKPYLIAGLVGTGIVSAVAQASGMIADYRARSKAEAPYSVPRGAVRVNQGADMEPGRVAGGLADQDYFFDRLSWTGPVEPLFGRYPDPSFPPHPENAPIRDFAYNSARSFNEVTDYYGTRFDISVPVALTATAFSTPATFGALPSPPALGTGLKVTEPEAINETSPVSPVPEPTTYMMLAAGLAMIVSVTFTLRKRRKP